jgi:tryptophan synthase alpha chain
LDYSLEPVIHEIRKHIRLPVGVGFGVSTPSQANKIASLADAVIVGSALVRIIEKYGDNSVSLLGKIGEFVSGLSKACDKQGVVKRSRKLI